MRVLFISTPGIGHAFPMVPLGWALRAGGHDVLFATAGPATAVANAGLPVTDIAPELDQPGDMRRRMVAAAARDRRDLYERVKAMRRDRKLDDLRVAAPLLSAISSYLTDGAVRAAEAWRPDLVVQSQSQGAGLVVAAKLRIPLVEHGFGIARSSGIHDLHRENMAEVFDRHGVADLPDHRVAIDVAPASLIDGPAEGWPMRYVPYNGGGVLPNWLARRESDPPRIAITLGTMEPGRSGLGVVRRVLDAARGIDAEFVLAIGSADPAELGALPPNVRAAGWVPLTALLPGCAGIIHHGGAGTTLTALDSGVPQLILPSGADRYINATSVARRGAGLTAEAETVDGDLVGRLLADGTLRAAAAEVRAEMRIMPSPTSVAERLPGPLSVV